MTQTGQELSKAMGMHKDQLEESIKVIEKMDEKALELREARSDVSLIDKDITRLEYDNNEIQRQLNDLKSTPNLDKERDELDSLENDLAKTQKDCAGVSRQLDEYQVIGTLLKDSGIFDGMEDPLMSPNPSTPVIPVDPVIPVNPEAPVYTTFTIEGSVLENLDVQVPQGQDPSDLSSAIYEITDGTIQIDADIHNQMSQPQDFKVVTNGGDVIVRNQDGTFRQLFEGVEEYALELQNGVSVRSTGNYQVMQFEQNGKNLAMI